MFRIKDPKVSIPWYEKVLGMEVSLPLSQTPINLDTIHSIRFEKDRRLTSQKFYEAGGSDFTNFFLAFPSGFPEDVKTDEQKKEAFKKREGILELCWNHGTGTSHPLPPLQLFCDRLVEST